MNKDYICSPDERYVMCDTDTFWMKMCSTKFVRLSRNCGKIENDIFYTENPPESIPGFVENIMDLIVSDLQLKMPRERWYSFKRKRWPWDSAHNSKKCSVLEKMVSVFR